MHRQSHLIEMLIGWISKAVIGFVALDLVLLIAASTGRLPPQFHIVEHWMELAFMSLAAVLPAAVATLNGIRF